MTAAASASAAMLVGLSAVCAALLALALCAVLARAIPARALPARALAIGLAGLGAVAAVLHLALGAVPARIVIPFHLAGVRPALVLDGLSGFFLVALLPVGAAALAMGAATGGVAVLPKEELQMIPHSPMSMAMPIIGPDAVTLAPPPPSSSSQGDYGSAPSSASQSGQGDAPAPGMSGITPKEQVRDLFDPSPSTSFPGLPVDAEAPTLPEPPPTQGFLYRLVNLPLPYLLALALALAVVAALLTSLFL